MCRRGCRFAWLKLYPAQDDGRRITTETQSGICPQPKAECRRLACNRRASSPGGGFWDSSAGCVHSRKPPSGETPRRTQARTPALRLGHVRRKSSRHVAWRVESVSRKKPAYARLRLRDRRRFQTSLGRFAAPSRLGAGARESPTLLAANG